MNTFDSLPKGSNGDVLTPDGWNNVERQLDYIKMHLQQLTARFEELEKLVFKRDVYRD